MKIGVLEQLKLSISEAGQLLGLHGSKLGVYSVLCCMLFSIKGYDSWDSPSQQSLKIPSVSSRIPLLRCFR